MTERAGITGLPLESAAEEAGVTKGGLMYHFRTREELLLAIQHHLTGSWEEMLRAELGKPIDEASVRDTTAAYVWAGTLAGASKADLAFMIESVSHPGLAQVWNDMMHRWAPPTESVEPSDIDLFLARLAIDGLWLHNATSDVPLSEPVREALRQRLLSLTEPEHTDPV